MRTLLTISFIAMSMFIAPLVSAEPTQLEVSALAHGAKFIGDGTGGARITISDAETGAVLAEGITKGGTGDTGLIMKKAQPHWRPVTSEGAASFTATLDIEGPRHIAITASGPLDADMADQARASTTTWLMPGEHQSGDGRVVIELLGYFVQVKNLEMTDGVSVVVDVGMLCGCPVVPGGLWDANEIDMRAVLHGSSAEEVTSLQHVEGTLYHAGFAGEVGEPQVVEFQLRGKNDSNVTVKRVAL